MITRTDIVFAVPVSGLRVVAIRALAVALLGGVVLQAEGVSVGSGIVIDWRTIKSGDTCAEGLDAFDSASLFAEMIGFDALVRLPIVKEAIGDSAMPRITAFAVQANGGRRRMFEVGGFRVMVEPESDDAAQELFTECLAALCAKEFEDS